MIELNKMKNDGINYLKKWMHRGRKWYITTRYKKILFLSEYFECFPNDIIY